MIKRFKMGSIIPLLVSGAITIFSSGCGRITDSYSLKKEALSNDVNRTIYEMPLDLTISEKEKAIFTVYNLSEIKDNYMDTTCDLIEEYILGKENEQYARMVQNHDFSKIYDCYQQAKQNNSEENIQTLVKEIREFLEKSNKRDLALSAPIIMASVDLVRNSDNGFTEDELNKFKLEVGDFISQSIDNQSIICVWQKFAEKQFEIESSQYDEMISENERIKGLLIQLEKLLNNPSDEEVQRMTLLEREFLDTCTEEELILASPMIYSAANISRNNKYSLSDEELNQIAERINPEEGKVLEK